mgnify:CR=1 FL=1
MLSRNLNWFTFFSVSSLFLPPPIHRISPAIICAINTAPIFFIFILPATFSAFAQWLIFFAPIDNIRIGSFPFRLLLANITTVFAAICAKWNGFIAHLTVFMRTVALRISRHAALIATIFMAFALAHKPTPTKLTRCVLPVIISYPLPRLARLIKL